MHKLVELAMSRPDLLAYTIPDSVYHLYTGSSGKLT